ncbi:MAG: site-2 protease family protein [Gemmatimonadaceae bacterium]|nr:site-2 protease family protein [Gemmatimonadaceae bacterium]
MDQSTLVSFALAFPALLFSLVAHEVAHAYAALKQGDTTARDLGRITLNPVRHIDPVMTILVPLMLFISSGGRFWFGGAKPVPVVPRNYRNFKRGDIIVSLAGVATNLVLAFVFAAVAALVGLALRASAGSGASEWVTTVLAMLRTGIYVNLGLCAFNLIPIPPLDGSHVFKYLLPPAWQQQYVALGRMGFIVLIVMLWVARPLISAWMAPAYMLGSWLDAFVVRATMGG